MHVKLQQTAVKFHATTDGTFEQYHNANAGEGSISPEMGWNQRRVVVPHLEMHSTGKGWCCKEPSNKEYILGDFANIVNVAQKHTTMPVLVTHVHTGGL